jgi:hypothetical protein
MWESSDELKLGKNAACVKIGLRLWPNWRAMQ